MLLSTHFLDERTLIVLDEPEVHLHPNWQLKYAEIITLLVKSMSGKNYLPYNLKHQNIKPVYILALATICFFFPINKYF
jgi:ABC-type cobalamin/Fe3+-siderophores transport system ATPase subunit